jgi:acetolactate synthase small subunit
VIDQTFVITAKAENILRVLQRIASFMTRKGLPVSEINVKESTVQHEFFLTLTLKAQEADVVWLMKQLEHIVDLFDLSIVNR